VTYAVSSGVAAFPWLATICIVIILLIYILIVFLVIKHTVIRALNVWEKRDNARTKPRQQGPSGREVFSAAWTTGSVENHYGANKELSILKDQVEKLIRQCEPLAQACGRQIESERQLTKSREDCEHWEKEARRMEGIAIEKSEVNLAAVKQIGELQKDIKESKGSLERIQGELKDARTKYEILKAEHAGACARLKNINVWLPVVQLEEVFENIGDKSGLLNREAAGNLNLVYSRLAVLLAALSSDDGDALNKTVLIRDTFNDFDSVLNVQLFRHQESLGAVRVAFEEVLKPMLAKYVTFRWPRVGEALDLKCHAPEEDNGKGVLTAVKSAVLHTTSGDLIQKASVLT